MQHRKSVVRFLIVGLALGAIILQIGCAQQVDKVVVGPGYTKAQVERGKYLAMHVSLCVDCHTPLLPDGKPDESKLFAGGLEFIPGKLWTRNITPDQETGIGSWTDEMILKAFRKGIGHYDEDPKNGKPLFPIMPYYVFANMTSDDAISIVAFLRTEVKPVKNKVPDRSSELVLPQPTKPLNYASLPGAFNDPGKYLTSAAGLCIECHTPRISQTPPDPSKLDPTKYFAGGEEFPIPGLKVASANITPNNETGIGTWTDAEIKKAIQEGINKEGIPLCPPMPWPSFANLNPVDVNAIVQFLRSLPDIKNKVEDCKLEGGPPK
jgi:mono/diheme cytochrome c family protein